MKELWKSIPGYESTYQVSSQGRVRSLPRVTYRGTTRVHLKGKLIKPCLMPKGYLRVNLHQNGHARGYYVHVLVAMVFVPNPHNFKEVNHIDENKRNNSADNLEWCSRQYNVNYGHRNERAELSSGHSVILSKNGKRYVFPTMTFAGAWLIKEGYTSLRNPHQVVSGISACARHKKNHKTVYGFKVAFSKNKEDQRQEHWHDIPGYKGLYQASNRGRVRRKGHYVYVKQYLPNRVLKPRVDKDGYYRVGLYRHRHQNMCRVNQLVAKAYLPNPKGLPQVNHKNENRKDNRPENLEWCTSDYNNSYGHRNERIIKKEGHALTLSKHGHTRRFKTMESAVKWIDQKAHPKGSPKGVRNNLRQCLRHHYGFHSVYGYVPRFVDDEWTKLSIQPLDV